MQTTDAENEERTLIATLEFLQNRLRPSWRFDCSAGSSKVPQSFVRSRKCRITTRAFVMSNIIDNDVFTEAQHLKKGAPGTFDYILYEVSLRRLSTPFEGDNLYVVLPRTDRDPFIICDQCRYHYLASVERSEFKMEPLYSYLVSQFSAYLYKLRIVRGDSTEEEAEKEIGRWLKMMYAHDYGQQKEE